MSLPLVLGLGAGAAVALIALSKKQEPASVPPGLPPAPASVSTQVPVADPQSVMKLRAALGAGDPGLNALNATLANPDAPYEQLRAYYDLLSKSGYHTDPLVRATMEKLAERMKSAPAVSTEPVHPTTVTVAPVPPIESRTPGVWEGLSVAQQEKIATILKALGVAPKSGTLDLTKVSVEAINAATAYAGELKRQGLETAAATLRKWASAAAAAVKCDIPEALETLPAHLACAIDQVSRLEKDPKKIREFIGRLQPYAGIPQVRLTITMLEAEAEKLEAAQRTADVVDDIDTIQTDGVPTPKEPPGMSAQLRGALDRALESLGVVDGKLTGPVRKASITYANQIGNLLKVNGFQREGDQLLELAKKAESMTAVVTPTPAPPTSVPPASTSPATYTVKAGDNPSKVAFQFTGDGNRWRELQAANPDRNFLKHFYAGWVLKLPASWLALPAPPTSAPPTSAPPTSIPIPTPPATYTVKAGDYPSKLAIQFTGDGNRWRELQAANPQYNFLKQFLAGWVLKLPASWQKPSVGADPWSALIGCVGSSCGCVGCGVSGNPLDTVFKVHFEQRGRKLYAHGYLNAKGVGNRILSASVDLKPILQMIKRQHEKLHQVQGCVGEDCEDQVGFKFKVKAKFIPKISKAARKVAKVIALRKVAKKARYVKTSSVKQGAWSVPETPFSTFGAIVPAKPKALETLSKASGVLEVLKSGQRLSAGVKAAGAKAAGPVGRLKTFAKKTYRSSKTRLLSTAKSRDLFTKYAPRKVVSTIDSLAKKAVRKKVGKILKRAPSLVRDLKKLKAFKSKMARMAKSSAVRRIVSTRQKVRGLVELAKRNPAAKKAVRILARVAEYGKEMDKKGIYGTQGLLINTLGQTIHGQYRRLPSGKKMELLMANDRKLPGYYEKVGVTGCVGC